MLTDRLIKKLAEKDFYRMKELYVASIMIVQNIRPSNEKGMMSAVAVPSYRFAVFHKPRFSKIYTRIKTGLEYYDFDKVNGGFMSVGDIYIAYACPMHEFLKRIMDFNYNPKELFMRKDEIIEFEDNYKMYLDMNNLYLDEILDNTL